MCVGRITPSLSRQVPILMLVVTLTFRSLRLIWRQDRSPRAWSVASFILILTLLLLSSNHEPKNRHRRLLLIATAAQHQTVEFRTKCQVRADSTQESERTHQMNRLVCAVCLYSFLLEGATHNDTKAIHTTAPSRRPIITRLAERALPEHPPHSPHSRKQPQETCTASKQARHTSRLQISR